MTNEKRYALDTNVILSKNIYEIVDKYNVAIPSMVIRELENFERNPDKYSQLSWKAREKRRRLKKMDKVYFDIKDYEWRQDDGLSKTYADNNILQYCLDTGSGLITFDGLLMEKAIEYGVEVIDVEADIEVKDDNYKGFKEAYMLPAEHQDFYTNKLAENVYDLNVNEYLIIRDDITGNEIDALKWNGEYHVAIKSKTLKSQKLGVFKPYDLYQTCAVDTVMNNQFSMLRGRAGVAKTAIALSYAMQELGSTSGKYSKIIIFSNAIPTQNAFYHGLVKGDLNSKLLSSSIGNILASKMGDKNEVEAMLITEQLTILPASDIRGFDSSGMNALIIITECQNWSRELLKLAIQRTGKDCKLILEGDNTTQLDDKMFEGSNNGMTAASEVFRGQPYYGEIELQKIYRSEIAERAELMTQM